MSDKQIWLENKGLLNQLKALDKTCQLFGAVYHRYKLNPICTTEEIADAEKRLGTQLPADLKAFYTFMGNGAAGPHYGIRQLNDLPAYFEPHLPYQGIQYYLDNSWKDDEDEEEEEPLDPNGYFEIEKELLNGLIPIIEEGCGHQTCIVTSGSMRNSIVYVSNDGYLQEANKPLPIIYQEWLTKSISYFETISQLVDTPLSVDEIKKEMREVFSWGNWDDLVMSYIGANKPIDLFGDGVSMRKSGGPERREWYEEQLRRYRNGEPFQEGIREPVGSQNALQLSKPSSNFWSWLTGHFKR